MDNNRARNEVIEAKSFCDIRLETIMSTSKSANSKELILIALEILQIQVAFRVQA